MYCPKCGTENPDDAQVCVNCSQPLTSIEAQPAAPTEQEQAQTSGMAIAALVFGLCSFCAGILTALPGIIFGIISLVKIKNSNGQLKGKGLAIGGIVTASVALVLQIIMLIAIMMPSLARVRSMSQRLVCGTNLSGLGKAMALYANDFDEKYPTPEKWCDLLAQYADVDEKQFICQGVQGSNHKGHYAINPKATPASPPDTVLLFEISGGWNQFGGPELLNAENHCGEGCNILFNDLHVEFVKKQEFENLRWDPLAER